MALKLRYNKVAFYGVTTGTGLSETTTYKRMHGFTDFSESKNVVTYERRYVDRKSSDTDVTGYAPSIAFSFDDYTTDDVCADIADIIDNEKIGTKAVRSIVVVDFTKAGVTTGTYKAYERKWSVIADSSGSGTDAYVYSGTLNAKSEIIWGEAAITSPATGGNNETAEEITFTPDSPGSISDIDDDEE